MASTSSTSSATSSASTTGYQLTSINSTSQLQLTGLASGLKFARSPTIQRRENNE